MSIHQAQLFGPGVYPNYTGKTDTNSLIASATESIHQTSLTPLGVYSTIQYKTTRNFPISLLIDSIHQPSLEHQTTLGVYQNNSNKLNSSAAISLLGKSIHQSSITSLGVYSNESYQSDTNHTNNPLPESIHQAPVVQGGSGLVYTFWKGESIVNHYRYKVKVNDKWQVKSVYIPVGKLPKVREAIANKLSVAAIVVEVLGRQL
jgi:hypothetical protein